MSAGGIFELAVSTEGQSTLRPSGISTLRDRVCMVMAANPFRRVGGSVDVQCGSNEEPAFLLTRLPPRRVRNELSWSR